MLSSCFFLALLALQDAGGRSGRSSGGGPSKRRLDWLLRYVREHPSYGPERAEGLWRSLQEVAVKTLLPVQPSLAHTYRTCFATQVHPPTHTPGRGREQRQEPRREAPMRDGGRVGG